MNVLATKHAAAERIDMKMIKEQISFIERMPFLKQAFNLTTVMILIMNKYRQIIFANNAFLKMLGTTEENELWGKRPGEILQCEHSGDSIYGCGTSEACRHCNAVNILLLAIEDKLESEGEISINRKINGYTLPMNLLENVAPLQVGNEIYYVASFIDASDTIRKRAMERIFFHDIINTAGALKGIIELLAEEAPENIKSDMMFVEKTFDYMIEEIRAQKQLTDAETNDLVPKYTQLDSAEILNYIVNLYVNHQLAKEKTIKIAEDIVKVIFSSDELLLKRVLSNMVKNALEATPEGGTITVGANYSDGENKKFSFWVQNAQYMPLEIQYKMFQRSFSTKGNGRGLGTYSMKLIGEKYLGGKVGFESTPDAGTRFYIEMNI